jgi:hypothetical protein
MQETNQEIEEKENDRRWLILRAKLCEESLKSAFRLFRQHAVEPILIKGWAAAREYPEKYERVFSDIDLCVAPNEFRRSLEIISTEEGKKLNIDLHCGLRHLDTVGWDDLFVNSQIVSLDEECIRVLCPEDHLRILCVHWLTDGGAYKERLLDIFYLLQNNLESFDWDLCFSRIDQNRRDWIIKTIAMVKRFYALDVSKMPFAEELDSVPKWFIKELEREWASERRLTDIFAVWRDRKAFWIQLKKRLHPNAIQATVFMEGKFDESPRIYYQAGSFFKRFKPSVRKALWLLRTNLQRKLGKNA